GAAAFWGALRWGAEVFHALRGILLDQGMSANVGDEGGFAPEISTGAEALELLVRAIEKAELEPGDEMALAMDPASSEFFADGAYRLERERRSSSDMASYYGGLLDRFPIVSIEDPLAEDDWEGWAKLTGSLGARCQVVGDDVFVTNPERLERGFRE